MAEAVTQVSYLLEIAGAAAVGFGSVMATGYVGFARLAAKFESHEKYNTEANVRIEDAIEKLNGTGRENTEAIIEIRARCEGNHS
jgi:hypothetical protein